MPVTSRFLLSSWRVAAPEPSTNRSAPLLKQAATVSVKAFPLGCGFSWTAFLHRTGLVGRHEQPLSTATDACAVKREKMSQRASPSVWPTHPANDKQPTALLEEAKFDHDVHAKPRYLYCKRLLSIVP